MPFRKNIHCCETRKDGLERKHTATTPEINGLERTQQQCHQEEATLKKHTAVETGRDGCERKHTATKSGINGLEVKIPNSLTEC